MKKPVLDNRCPGTPYDAAELTADRAVHFIGLFSGGLGSAFLICVALCRLGFGRGWPIIVYSICLASMLSCSAAYNLTRCPAQRELLRRFDHAAIFLMIAGTYTPFTTRMPDPRWAIGMTGGVWAVALAGAFMKLSYPRSLERIDLALYLGLGWMIVIAWKPFLAVVDPTAAALIIAGGSLYTVGAGFHAWRSLRYQNGIWHGFVLVAAACHYAAVSKLVGV